MGGRVCAAFGLDGCGTQRELDPIQGDGGPHLGGGHKIPGHPADGLRQDGGVLLLPFGGVLRHPELKKSEGRAALATVDLVVSVEGEVLDGGVIKGLGLLVPRIPDERFARDQVGQVELVGADQIGQVAALLDEANV